MSLLALDRGSRSRDRAAGGSWLVRCRQVCSRGGLGGGGGGAVQALLYSLPSLQSLQPLQVVIIPSTDPLFHYGHAIRFTVDASCRSLSNTPRKGLKDLVDEVTV